MVRLTMSAICGTDLHMARGTMPDMVPGTVLGHEGVGVVEAVGGDARGFRPGDRVVIRPPFAVDTVSIARSSDLAASAGRRSPRHGVALLLRTIHR